jgi:N-ethylmaleimide reductase
MDKLFSPLKAGALSLATRVVMAPLTRSRAPHNVPTDLMVTYYRQRANPATGMGLIITEASPISPMAHGYIATPGIHSDEQVAGWKKVTEAVHAEGGRIVIQLWHVGRISHTALLPNGASPVSSSNRIANVRTRLNDGFAMVSQPRAMTLEEIAATVQDYRHAARNAMAAGFDGVEIHAANGYLIEQFLRDSCNDRTDAYGGSIDNRTRFLQEVTAAVVAEIGADRTGIRLSPVTPANDMGQDSDAQALFNHVAKVLAPFKLAYVHVIEGATGGARDLTDQGVAPFDYAAFRKGFGQTAWMVNNGYTRAMAVEAVESGAGDLVAFGKPAIANPDLGRRLREGAALNAIDPNTLYGGGAEGYTDYPTL